MQIPLHGEKKEMEEKKKKKKKKQNKRKAKKEEKKEKKKKKELWQGRGGRPAEYAWAGESGPDTKRFSRSKSGLTGSCMATGEAARKRGGANCRHESAFGQLERAEAKG